MPEEIKPQGQTPDLGKAQSPNLGQACSPNLGEAGNPVKEEIKVEPDNNKVKPETPPAPPTDFKIAEIWIRSGQIMLDASESFWSDRCRAIGVLEFCKEIVKTAQAPKKPNIIIPGNGKMLNFARNIKNTFMRRK